MFLILCSSSSSVMILILAQCSVSCCVLPRVHKLSISGINPKVITQLIKARGFISSYIMGALILHDVVEYIA